MSQSGLARGLGSGGGGGTGILTVTGNAGGPISSVSNNLNLITSNTSLGFVGTSGTETLNFNLSNLLMGSSYSGSGAFNLGTGRLCLSSLTTANENIAYGHRSLQNLTSGNGNIAYGLACGINLIDGSQNIFLGYGSASSYVGSESFNICIGSGGEEGESATTRIGSDQNRFFAAGIYSVSGTGSSLICINPVGQITDLGYGESGQFLISNGAAANPSWESNPSLSAFVSASTVPNVTGDSYDLIDIICDTIDYQSGSNYNTTTGVYTIPVDGLYQISAAITWSNLDVLNTRSQIVLNFSDGSQYLMEANPSTSKSVNNILSQNIMTSKYLTSGETVKISGFVGGTTKTVGYQGDFFGQGTYFNIIKLN